MTNTHTCTDCGTEFKTGLFWSDHMFCRKCFGKRVTYRVTAPRATAETSKAADKSGTPPVPRSTTQSFDALRTYAFILTGLGWLQVIAGCGFSLAMLDKLGATSIAIGLAVAAFGFGFVVAGQAVTCFVEIEHQSRRTADILERIEGSLLQKNS